MIPEVDKAGHDHHKVLRDYCRTCVKKFQKIIKKIIENREHIDARDCPYQALN